MWPAFKRQLRYEDYFLSRDLPPTAKPYREDFHMDALGDARRRSCRRTTMPTGSTPAPPTTSTPKT